MSSLRRVKWYWWAVALVVVLGVVGSLGKGSSPKTAASSTPPTSSTTPATTTPAKPSLPARQDILDALSSGSPFGLRSSVCGRGICVVQLHIGDTVFGSEHEVVEPMFPVFKALFGFKGVKKVDLVAYGTVTSVGGKASTAKLLEVSCTRKAADQINWDALTMNGIHALCSEARFVQFST